MQRWGLLTRLISARHFIVGGWRTSTMSRQRLGVEVVVQADR